MYILTANAVRLGDRTQSSRLPTAERYIGAGLAVNGRRSLGGLGCHFIQASRMEYDPKLGRPDERQNLEADCSIPRSVVVRHVRVPVSTKLVCILQTLRISESQA